MASGKELVLVTGASGYLATHIVQQLQQAGYRVRGTVRSLSNPKKVSPLHELCPEAKHKLELVEADLEDESSWKNAVADCTYVMHVASPLPADNPQDEQEVIGPAVNGTRHVLEACRATGSCVKRVVLTSSTAAMFGGRAAGTHSITEEDWSDLSKCNAYYRSKTMAEKAAWDLVGSFSDKDHKFELVVMNPGYIVGPMLHNIRCTSAEFIIRILNRETPMLVNLSLPALDVRDVAAAHIAGLTAPEAAGRRHILSGGQLSMKDLGRILSHEFDPQGYNCPTKVAPMGLLKLLALFDKTVRMIIPELNKIFNTDNTRMTSVLGIRPRPLDQAVIDMGYSVIERGLAKKTRKYRGAGGTEGQGQSTYTDQKAGCCGRSSHRRVANSS